MKLLVWALLGTVATGVMANDAPSNVVVKSKDIYIDGQAPEENAPKLNKVAVDDDELKFFKNELQNVKNLNKSFKAKSKTLAKMAEEAEQLKEQHLEYMENRIDWEVAIDDYNKQADCMSKDPKTCSKFLKPKRKSRRDSNESRGEMEQKPVSYQPLPEMPVDANIEMVATEPAPKFDERQFVSGVDSVIAANSDLLGDCLNRYASKTRRDFSVVYAQLTINKNGALSHLGIENPEAIPNRDVLSCMSTVLHSLAYPAGNAREIKVRKPFSLVIKRS